MKYDEVRKKVLAAGLTINEVGLVHWEVREPGVRHPLFAGTLVQIAKWLPLHVEKNLRQHRQYSTPLTQQRLRRARRRLSF